MKEREKRIHRKSSSRRPRNTQMHRQFLYPLRCCCSAKTPQSVLSRRTVTTHTHRHETILRSLILAGLLSRVKSNGECATGLIVDWREKGDSTRHRHREASTHERQRRNKKRNGADSSCRSIVHLLRALRRRASHAFGAPMSNVFMICLATASGGVSITGPKASWRISDFLSSILISSLPASSFMARRKAW